MDRVKSCLLYNIGLIVSSDSLKNPVILNFIKEFSTIKGTSTILNSSVKTSSENAAFINAAMNTSRGQNDTHTSAGSHLGCIVVALALAEELDSKDEEVIAAILAGYEIIARIGANASSLVSEKGFRPTPIFALYGAVATASKLYELDRNTIAHAFSIATNMSAGLLQTWQDGSMEWQWQIAFAAKNGILAAKLAKYGVIGAKHAFEGENGFFRLTPG